MEFIIASAFILHKLDSYLNRELQTAFLLLIQRRILFLIPIMVFASLIPPVSTYVERRMRRDETIANNNYIKWNAIFNSAGALIISALAALFRWQIDDVLRLNAFPIWILLGFVMVASILLVITYQEKEMNTKYIIDHSADAKLLNQILNMIYLFLVYTFGFTMGLLEIIYSLRWKGTMTDRQMWVAAPLGLIMVFFYLCAFSRIRHVRFAFEIGVPGVLVAMFLWMKGFEKGKGVVIAELLFFLINISIYLFAHPHVRRFIISIVKWSETTHPPVKAYKFFYIIFVLVLVMLFGVVAIASGIPSFYK